VSWKVPGEKQVSVCGVYPIYQCVDMCTSTSVYWRFYDARGCYQVIFYCMIRRSRVTDYQAWKDFPGI